MIYVLLPLFSVILGFGIFLLYIVMTEYKPAAIEDAEIIRNSRDNELNDVKTITTFNLGYCSLDKDQDFFLEGGTSSRTKSKEKTFDNLISIEEFLLELDSDYYFLQEVDVKGVRSANVNQVEHLTSGLTDYNVSFSYNYKARWVPIPLMKPMGSAFSGLVTLSKQSVEHATRINLIGQEMFPKSLFYPKRCMMVNELKIDGKLLYLINVHLSAYDVNGMYRSKQIRHIIQYISDLYNNKQCHIIVGGDFNLLLDKTLFSETMPEWVNVLPDELYESVFNVVYDKNVNTVRSQERPYVKGLNFETVIDGFIVSPNVIVEKIEGHDLGYKHTDHNPVTLSFRLR